MYQNEYFDVVNEVLATWYEIKKLPDFDNIVGKMLLQKIFELDPKCNWGSRFAFLANMVLFEDHCQRFIRMLDVVIDMLGPEMGIAEETLKDLGAKHVEYGVRPEHYRLLGQALLETISTILGRTKVISFQQKSKDAWEVFYTFMSECMVQGGFEAQSF